MIDSAHVPAPFQLQSVPSLHPQKRRQRGILEGREVQRKPLCFLRLNCLDVLQRDRIMREEFWGLFVLKDPSAWQKQYADHSWVWFTEDEKGNLQQQVQMFLNPQKEVCAITLQRRIGESSDFSSICLQDREEEKGFFFSTMQDVDGGEGRLYPSGQILDGRVEEGGVRTSCYPPSKRVRATASTPSPVTCLLSLWSEPEHGFSDRKMHLKFRPLSEEEHLPLLLWQPEEKMLAIFRKRRVPSAIILDLAKGVLCCVQENRKLGFARTGEVF